MELLIVFCSTLSCKEALDAYRGIIQKSPGTGIAIMDFSGKTEIEAKNKDALKKANQEYSIPAYFWSQSHNDELISSLTGTLPRNVISLMDRKVLDYGWMRNRATLLTLAAGAKAIQSFDIDTVPSMHNTDILQVHQYLLNETKMAVVSGNYLGPRAITTSMFNSVDGQTGFLRLIKQTTGFDVLNPPVVGGESHPVPGSGGGRIGDGHMHQGGRRWIHGQFPGSDANAFELRDRPSTSRNPLRPGD